MRKILLDSNAYFRLADNLYPLLSEPFGKDNEYRLYILSGTLGEYNYQARLQSKFDWVDNPKHQEDRKQRILKCSKSERDSIKNTTSFILDESRRNSYTCSRFDIECLATAYELSFILATDDGDLYHLAKEYEVNCISTIELLKLMLEEKRITLKEVQDTVYMWSYMNDLPRNFKKDFMRAFSVQPELY
jgi:hypothetical protein